MSQNSIVLPTTGTVSGLQIAQDINNALDTLNTLASGASAPSSPEAGQLWHDTTNNLIKLRSLDNTTWIPFLQLSESAYAAAPSGTPTNTNDRLNRAINGGMSIDQVNEGASYSVPNNNTPTYCSDQWVVSCGCSTASGVTGQRVTDAPANFTNSLKVTVGTGGTVGATDFLYVYQPIEANNLNDLNYGTVNALPASLSFWVKSSIAGTFAAVLQNAAGNRSCVNKFTIASPGVWQQVTIPNIPGDQSGSWATGGSAMLNLFIVIATGATDQSSTLNAWQGGDFLGSTSQTNTVLTTNGATFQITGVQFNSGVFCQPYEKRTIQQEIQLCERYYEKTFPQGTAVAQNAGVTGAFGFLSTASGGFGTQAPFRTLKRAAATITTFNPSASNANWRDSTNSADRTVGASSNLSDKGFLLYATGGGVSQAGNYIHYTASARM